MQKLVPCSNGGLEVGEETGKFALSGEDRLKERLLKAATEVFLEKGLAATSVDEIASREGLEAHLLQSFRKQGKAL